MHIVKANCFKVSIIKQLSYFRYDGLSFLFSKSYFQISHNVVQTLYSPAPQSVSDPSALTRRFINIEPDGPIEIPDRSKPNQEIKAPRRRREIVMKMHTVAYASVFQPGNVVFDGKATLFTEKDLGFGNREVGSSYLILQ